MGIVKERPNVLGPGWFGFNFLDSHGIGRFFGLLSVQLRDDLVGIRIDRILVIRRIGRVDLRLIRQELSMDDAPEILPDIVFQASLNALFDFPLTASQLLLIGGMALES